MLKLHLGSRMSGEKMSVEAVALSSAIYGSMRFRAARDIIKRIMKTEGTPKPAMDFALKVFEQVGHIEDLRDRIAHHAVVPAYKGAEEYWQVTDAMSTKDIREPKVYVFSEEAVVKAALDLIVAGDRLGGTVVGPKLFADSDFDVSPPPWLYRPSMLKLVPQNKLRSPLGPSPQR